MLRPSINGSLEEQIEEHMQDAGIDSKAEFVRYACRREIERQRELSGADR